MSDNVQIRKQAKASLSDAHKSLEAYQRSKHGTAVCNTTRQDVISHFSPTRQQEHYSGQSTQ